MEYMTLMIDTETRDLVFDEDGFFKTVHGDDTMVQNVRHALITWKKEFFADLEHGTEYERIMGTNQNDIDIEEIKEILREAILQEPEVARVDKLTASYDGRNVSAEFSATLVNGNKINLEVTA